MGHRARRIGVKAAAVHTAGGLVEELQGGGVDGAGDLVDQGDSFVFLGMGGGVVCGARQSSGRPNFGFWGVEVRAFMIPGHLVLHDWRQGIMSSQHVRVQGARRRAAGEPPPEPDGAVCLHFQRGTCKFGAECAFRHICLAPRSTAEESKSSLAACQEAYRAAERRLAAMRAANAPHEQLADAAAVLTELLPRIRALTGAASSRLAVPRRQRRVKNENRAGTFRRFLKETFGASALAAGSGVIDVAGGQGVLSFELLNYEGIPVTVVDPRHALRLERRERYFAAVHRARPAGAEDADENDDAPREARRPRHWPVYWNDALWKPALSNPAGECESGADEGSCGEFGTPSSAALYAMETALNTTPQQALSSRRHRKLAVPLPMLPSPPPETPSPPSSPSSCATWADGESGAGTPACIAPARTTPTVPPALEVWHALRECSALVGMHPDAATESIVDFALEAGKPFAVVPCCVFAIDFPQRRGADGRPIDTHGAFVRYLQAKAPDRIHTATLAFEGKNVVVYSRGGLPPSCGPSTPEEPRAKEAGREKRTGGHGPDVPGPDKDVEPTIWFCQPCEAQPC